MIILGVDPGTATTGYGVITMKNRENPQKQLLRCLAYGCIVTDAKLSNSLRLQKIYRELSGIIRLYKPRAVAIENIYFFKNIKTALPVSQAKGVVMLAAAQKKIPVYEYTPLQVKSAVVGYGTAHKKQVQRMIQEILGLNALPRPDDAADALGVALCCMLYLKAKRH